ncbi:phospholipase D-like domain-containing protein [Modestobacter lapidis]|nr:cardiolipin synthase B [Modestobacter lapidis]
MPTPAVAEPRPATAARNEPASDELRAVLEGLLGVPFTEGNRIDVLRNGEETFPAMLAAISAAERSIDMLWFAWRDSDIGRRIADALADRAGRGVRVRVLLDAYGTKMIGRDTVTRLRDAGCSVLFYRLLPGARPTVWNLRSHRRVLVCDETVALTGGTGVADTWGGDGDRPGSWRDTAYLVRGPAVAGVRAGFALPWLQAQARGGRDGVLSAEDRFPPLTAQGSTAVQVLRPASAPGWNEAALAIAALLQSARHQVRVTTPYLRLPRWLRELIVATADRGVAVSLLVSGPHRERPSVHLQGQREYQRLLDAGVEIWRYQPTLLHTKVVTVDGELAMVGTANLDVRSLALNEQLCLVVADRAVVGTLDDHFDDDLTVSTRVDAERWRARPVTHRVLEAAADVVGRPLRGLGSLGLVGRRPGRGFWTGPSHPEGE